ncbi:MAG: relaxase/mobilization nuclease domain-containing protein [Prevotella sp.]
MIIKKLKQVSGGVFPGAAYNETKVEQGVADFAGVANVDGNFLLVLNMLHDAGVNCAHEVEQYLQDHSNTFGNSKSTRLQFHYALSVKGREKNKEQLVDIAHQLMKEFGAEHNPYFIYFHRDTENNHVHILGTRVKPNGTLLSDHQDFRRLNESLNRIVQKDQFQDMNELLSYSFQTEGQLMNIIREFGFTTGENKEEPDKVIFYHGGAEAFKANLADLTARNAVSKDDRKKMERREDASRQLKAIFFKYREQSLMLSGTKDESQKKVGRAKNRKDLMKPDGQLKSDIARLTDASGKRLGKEEQQQLLWFLQQLRSKFGVSIIFQKDRNGVVRGYGIVDHTRKMALNGSEVMKLADILDFKEQKQPQAQAQSQARPTKPKEEHHYQRMTILDVYRDLFTVQVGTVNGRHVVRMTMDGKTYDHEISDKQTAWYHNTKSEGCREDIAIHFAAFYFHKEIYEAYRKRLIEERIKNGEPAWQIPYDKVRLYKLMNGRWQLAIDVGHMPVKFTLTEEEGRMCNRVGDVPKEREALKCRLVKEYVLREETEVIADHYHYNNVGIRPEQGKDGFVGTMNFVQQHSALMHRLQSVLSVNAASTGYNREYEVGGRSRWEEIDDECSLKR